MKYAFFLVAGAAAFTATYCLTISSQVKSVSLSEVSSELKANKKHAAELVRFNKRHDSVTATPTIAVDPAIENVIRENDVNPALYRHLTDEAQSIELYQQQVNELIELAQRDPEKTVGDYKQILAALRAQDKVMEYGLTMVQMSQVPDLHKEVAELSRKDLTEHTVKEITAQEVQTMEEENKRLSDDKYVNSLNMTYLAFLNTQIKAEQNPLNETIDIIARNNHGDLRRNIASTYLQAYPDSYDDLMHGLKAEEIDLSDVQRIEKPTRPPEGNQ